MVPQLFTYYEPFQSEGEVNSGEDLVERVYIDHNELIESMIFAGERLQLARKEAFDIQNEEDIENASIDPTRIPGFDLADASRISAVLASKAEAVVEEKKKAREKEEVEKSKKLKEEIIAEYEASKEVKNGGAS